jgi:hypothetical protein
MASWGSGINFFVDLKKGTGPMPIHFPAGDYLTAADALHEACRQFRAAGYEPIKYYVADETEAVSLPLEEAAKVVDEMVIRDAEREELEEYEEHPDDWKGQHFIVWNDKNKEKK